MDSFKTYTLISHLMILAGLLSLTVAGGMMEFVIIGSAACILSAFLVEIRGSFSLGHTWATIFTVLAFIYSVLDVAEISNSVLVGFSHFLILLQVIKLLQRKGDRDYLQLFVISFIQLVIASAMATSLFYAAAFIAYLLLATWTITMFHIRREVRRVGGSPPQIPPTALTGGFFIGVSMLALTVFVLTLAIFVVFPRVGLGLMSVGRGDSIMISGFSDRVKLGDIGKIKLSPRVVMRVEVKGGRRASGGGLMLRGVMLDHYSNGTWSTAYGRDRYIRVQRDGVAFLNGPSSKGEEDLVEHRITMERADSRVLFHPPNTVKAAGKFRWLMVDGNGSISFMRAYTEGAQYTVYSNPSAGSARWAPPGRGRPAYLQLERFSERVAAMAGEITEGAENPYQAARMIEQHLLTNYAYTLDLKSTPGAEPVEDFLFNLKAGHCEYFASAMVIMLRTLGIPARLVNGFRGGEWNETGHYYVVRERNAHSWVEAYFPERGWITFDPTPPDPYPSSFMPGMINFLPRFFDSLRLKWYRYVIDFDTSSQRTMVRDLQVWLDVKKANLRNRITSWREAMRGSIPSPRVSLWIIPIVAAALLIIVILRFSDLISSLKPRKGGRRAIASEVRFYRDLSKLLGRIGYRRSHSTTPLELAEAILTLEGEPFAGVIPLTDIYYKVRFGKSSLTRVEKEEVRHLLSALKERVSDHRISRKSPLRTAP